MSGRVRAEALLVAAVYVGATVVFTWPVARLLPTHFLGPVDSADMLLTLWILRWDLHALGTDPSRLFESNAFHPAPHALAGQEHLLGMLPLFGPLWVATENPILALNAATLMSFILSGLFTHALVRAWTGSTAAAYVAGLAFAYAPWRLPSLGSPHLLHAQYFPLIVLGLERVATTASMRVALATGLALALQSLCSYYLAYMAFTLVGAYLLAELAVRGVRGRRDAWLALGLTFLVALVVLVPTSIPYLQLRAGGQLSLEHLDPVTSWGPLVREIGAPARVAAGIVGWGTFVAGLVAVVVLGPRTRRDRSLAVRVVALVLATLAAFILAPGAAGPAGMASAFVPGLANLRAPFRFGFLASFALAALAGLGAGAVLGRLRAGLARNAVAALLVGGTVAGCVLPAWRTARGGRPTSVFFGPAVPPVYRWLATHGEGGALLEVPIPAGAGWQLAGARAQYASTYHWLPIVTGHTGYFPPFYSLFLRHHIAQLPASEAAELVLECTGVRWVLVHGHMSSRRSAWAALPRLRLRGRFPADGDASDDLYEVEGVTANRCRGLLFQRDRTVEDNPIVLPSALVGRLSVDGLSLRPAAGAETAVTMRLANDGPTLWPCTGIDPRQRVALTVRWLGEGERRSHADLELLVPRDVPPGGEVAFTAWLRHPAPPGRYRLQVAGVRGEAVESELGWEESVIVGPPVPRPD